MAKTAMLLLRKWNSRPRLRFSPFLPFFFLRFPPPHSPRHTAAIKSTKSKPRPRVSLFSRPFPHQRDRKATPSNTLSPPFLSPLFFFKLPSLRHDKHELLPLFSSFPLGTFFFPLCQRWKVRTPEEKKVFVLHSPPVRLFFPFFVMFFPPFPIRLK